MARKRARILDDAINARMETSEKEAEAPRREYTAERESLISEASEGRLRNGKLRLVDPKECRMWAGHNRLYDLLTPESCGDLIKSIKAVGRQEMPAIVRPTGEGGTSYEVICGARRHFAVNHLREIEHRSDILYLVDIRDITDEEAFRLADLENREREDISDFERSRDYARALTAYYDDNKALMAERIGVDRTWLSRFLRIGELPDPILRAYGDVRGIGIRHAAELSPLLGSDAAKAILAEAERLAEAREEGATKTAAQVLAALKSAASSPKVRNVETILDGEGKTILTSETKSRTKVLTIPRGQLHDKAALMKAIEEALF